MENVIELKTYWNEIIWKLKQKFSLLPVNELICIEGKHDESLGKLQVIFGKTKEEMNHLISNL
ncbi:MAG: general stress protein CsbD [Bacteroidia bacterium]